MDIKDRIAELKEEFGMTTVELSNVSGIPIGTINKILLGDTPNPRLSTLAALAKALSCSLDYLSGLDNETMQGVAENINTVRLNRGIPLKMLADRLGITQQQLMRYESGKMLVSYNLLSRMAQVLQVPTSDLLDGPKYFTPETVESESRESSQYMQKMSQVLIWAIIPDSISDAVTLYASIEFACGSLANCRITIPDEFLTTVIFPKHHSDITDRKFITKIGQNAYRVVISHDGLYVTLVMSDEEAHQLCELLDHMYDVYSIKISAMREIAGCSAFRNVDGRKYAIAKIPRDLWFDLYAFAQEHDCRAEYSIWNIFLYKNFVPGKAQMKTISLFCNDNDTIRADLLAELQVEDLESPEVTVYWMPGYTPLVSGKNAGFDNKLKWKADFTHDWLLQQFIPQVISEKGLKKAAVKRYLDENVISLKGTVTKEPGRTIFDRETEERLNVFVKSVADNLDSNQFEPSGFAVVLSLLRQYRDIVPLSAAKEILSCVADILEDDVSVPFSFSKQEGPYFVNKLLYEGTTLENKWMPKFKSGKFTLSSVVEFCRDLESDYAAYAQSDYLLRIPEVALLRSKTKPGRQLKPYYVARIAPAINDIL